jgi:hypothetical protein
MRLSHRSLAIDRPRIRVRRLREGLLDRRREEVERCITPNIKLRGDSIRECAFSLSFENIAIRDPIAYHL